MAEVVGSKINKKAGGDRNPPAFLKMWRVIKVRRVKIRGLGAKIILAAIFVLMFSTVSEAGEAEEWWNEGEITVIGQGIAPEKTQNNDALREQTAKQAEQDAIKNLVDLLKNIRVTEGRRITESEARQIAAAARKSSPEYDERGSCVLELIVPLYGEVDSVAKVVFKPANKASFPEPLNAAAVAEGTYTGLIVDCADCESSGKTGLEPLMMLRLMRDDGAVIYAYENLNYDLAVKNGVVGYANDVAAVKTSAFLGQNPLIVKATGIDKDNGCPIIDAIWADKILTENRATNFLSAGKVVIVSRSIKGAKNPERGQDWGIRDSYAGSFGDGARG